MNNVLKKFRAKFSTEELEEIIRKYYIDLDDSIDEVVTKYFPNDENEYFDTCDVAFTVTIKHKVKMFGTSKQVESESYLNSSDLKAILLPYFEKDKLKILSISGKVSDKDQIIIQCEKPD